MRWTIKQLRVEGKETKVELKKVESGAYTFDIDGKEVTLKNPTHFPYSFRSDEVNFSCESWAKDRWRVISEGKLFEFAPHREGENGRKSSGRIQSQMPGRILKVLVKEGDDVKESQTLIIIEAMKMENEIRAESDGKVKSIPISEGQSLDSGTTLIEFEELPK